MCLRRPSEKATTAPTPTRSPYGGHTRREFDYNRPFKPAKMGEGAEAARTAAANERTKPRPRRAHTLRRGQIARI